MDEEKRCENVGRRRKRKSRRRKKMAHSKTKRTISTRKKRGQRRSHRKFFRTLTIDLAHSSRKLQTCNIKRTLLHSSRRGLTKDHHYNCHNSIFSPQHSSLQLTQSQLGELNCIPCRNQQFRQPSARFFCSTIIYTRKLPALRVEFTSLNSDTVFFDDCHSPQHEFL